MILLFLRTAYFFKIAFILSLLGIKSNRPLYYSGKSLNKKSFRFPEKAYSDYFISIRIYKRILLSLFKNGSSYIKFDKGSKEAIFDSFLDALEMRVEYIENLNGTHVELIIAKNELLNVTRLLQKIIIFLYLTLSFVPVFLISSVAKNKIKYPLLILELIECFNLLVVLKHNKINKVHYFSIFERDANLSAYILMKEKIYVNKIPSEVPLVFANKIIVANELSFCFAYQKEEFEEFKSTIFVKKTQQWVPETFFKTPKRLLSSVKKEVKPKFDIGFFSTGNWLRETLGHIDLGGEDKKNEEELLKNL